MPIPHAHLRSFHAVATHGSFTLASKRLNITQPTLSGQVKELEQRYGTKLFIRHGRRVTLTELGKATFRISQLLFRHEQEIEELLQSARALTSGELRVAADSPYLLTPLLTQFQARYPGIQISIQYGNSSQIMSLLESRRCDVAFMPNVDTNAAHLHTQALLADSLVAFVGAQHPWRQRNEITLDELLQQRIVLREIGSRTRAVFTDAVQASGQELKDIMEIGSREGVREAVAGGFGVGIIAASELGNDDRLHALSLSDTVLTHTQYLVCLQEMATLRVNEAFLQLVAQLNTAQSQSDK